MGSWLQLVLQHCARLGSERSRWETRMWEPTVYLQGLQAAPVESGGVRQGRREGIQCAGFQTTTFLRAENALPALPPTSRGATGPAQSQAPPARP